MSAKIAVEVPDFLRCSVDDGEVEVFGESEGFVEALAQAGFRL
jgi:hypothetical protein